MSEEQDHSSDSALMALFEKRKADLRCPVCKNDEFLVMDRWSENEALLLEFYRFKKGAAPAKTGGVKTVAIACGNCGHVQQFVLNLLQREQETS